MTETLTIEHIASGRVRVAGALGFGEAGAAFARSEEILLGSTASVDVDIGGLRCIDSATLAVLIAWAARAAAKGIRLRLSGTPASLQALAHLCDAEPLLGIS